MADKTIHELISAESEVAIGDLPSIDELYSDTLIPVEQQGEARKMTGGQWANYARDSVLQYTKDAESYANVASKKASDAETSAEKAVQYSKKPPIIRYETWWVWEPDNQEYIDTNMPARGEVGSQGPPGPPPIISESTHHWMVYTEAGYVDTGIPASQLIDENTGNAVRVWFGTVAEYNALPVHDEPGVWYNIMEGTP